MIMRGTDPRGRKAGAKPVATLLQSAGSLCRGEKKYQRSHQLVENQEDSGFGVRISGGKKPFSGGKAGILGPVCVPFSGGVTWGLLQSSCDTAYPAPSTCEAVAPKLRGDGAPLTYNLTQRFGGCDPVA